MTSYTNTGTPELPPRGGSRPQPTVLGTLIPAPGGPVKLYPQVLRPLQRLLAVDGQFLKRTVNAFFV